MTLEEAIKHCEELAEENEKKARKKNDGTMSTRIKYEECAKERRQLAEWLKELKGYKDFENNGYIMCRFEVTQDGRHRITKMVLDFSTKKLFDKQEQ